LTKAKDGIPITRALSEYRLEWKRLKEHFGFLMNKELLEYNEGDRLYRTTEKGENFIETVERMKRFKIDMSLEDIFRKISLL